MKIFSTSESQRETLRWSAPPSAWQISDALLRRLYALAVFIFTVFAIGGCGYAGTPPKPSVDVSVQPTSASVTLGATQQFQATVTGSTDTTVAWEVNGVANGNTISGTVDGTGLYTAPAVMPSPATVTVTAISQVNPGDHASATVMLQAGSGAVSVLPATATVAPGGAQIFTASISGSGTLAGGAAWSVNGVAGGNATSGMIVVNEATSAVYTAPATIPSPATATAASVADPTKAGSALITIACAVPNAIAPPSALVALGQAQTLTATFCGAIGAQVAWDVNGISGGNSVVGTIVVAGLAGASYTAPANRHAERRRNSWPDCTGESVRTGAVCRAVARVARYRNGWRARGCGGRRYRLRDCEDAGWLELQRGESADAVRRVV